MNHTQRHASRPMARPQPGTKPRPSRPLGARRAPASVRSYRTSAQRQLRRFRQGSGLAVAITALLLFVGGAPQHVEGQSAQTGEAQTEIVTDASVAVDEAATTMRQLALSFYGFLPRIVLVLVLFGAASLISRLARATLRRTLRGWERIEAANALTRLAVFAAATIAAVSVLAGDVRAVVGSVGLLGLAASWALQTPIESFTGWLLNSFKRYYRVGDRIAVGDVFGDVYRIDVLTTTVWEAGGPGKPVRAAQSTGAQITFPNWEVLRSNIVNYTRDFPYVWDEVTFTISNESDMRYASELITETARRVLGAAMPEAAHHYQQLLERERLTFEVEDLPRVYLSLAVSWTECTVRYVVPVRARRHWSSMLVLAVTTELARPEHTGRVAAAYPRREVVVQSKWSAPE